MNDVSGTSLAREKDAVELSSHVNVNGNTTQPQAPSQKRPRPRKKGPNYAQIHSKPLPLETYPLPAFHPSNPASLLRLCYVYLSYLVYPPSSHPTRRYTGIFSPETRSVHVTDPKHVRALWEMGFFGKGSLSRSEPSWLDREKAKLQAEKGGGRGRTAEEATNVRREERRLFKLERARLEREKIEKQKLVEEGLLSLEADGTVHDETATAASTTIDDATTETDPLLIQVRGATDRTSNAHGNVAVPEPYIETTVTQTPDVRVLDPNGAQLEHLPSQTFPMSDHPEPNIENQEHLQLTLEEAFFLSYALGVLDIWTPSPDGKLVLGERPIHTREQYDLFAQHAWFPAHSPISPSTRVSTAPDNQFVINYVVYHHFRSLGWVIRPGVKFSCDYMLYHRGPVFSHAEFAVLIVPAYSHHYWNTEEGRKQRRVAAQGDWWWLHCINRVQSQVRKTLVLCYVDVPPPIQESNLEEVDIGAMLRGYKVREFLIRRWLANRSRD